MSDMRDVVIIGSGPAGYTAAIYLDRAGFEPLVVVGALMPGGQLVNTTEVENFPGFPDGIMGPDLMDNMRKQAERFGTHIVWDDVVSVASNADSGIKTVTLDGGDVYDARALVIATGSNYRKLGVPGETEYAGKGVSYCATCDGFFFRNKPIVVVGGGDSASAVKKLGFDKKMTHISTGGGALLKGLDQLLREETSLPITVVEDPLSTVVMGTGRALDNLNELGDVCID